MVPDAPPHTPPPPPIPPVLPQKQFLVILFKSRSISDGTKWVSGEKSAFVNLCDPFSKGLRDHGLVLAKNSGWLGEWNLRGIGGAPEVEIGSKNRGGVTDNYRIQIEVTRDNASVLWNIVFTMVVVIVLSFTGFGCVLVLAEELH